MAGNLPDDFSWRLFDAYYGDDQKPEDEDIMDAEEDMEDAREYWLARSEHTKEK